MVFAVEQFDLDIDHREAGDHARGQDAVEARFDAGDIFLRHRAAGDLRLELVALAGLVWLDMQLDERELVGAARLLLVRVFELDTASRTLTEGRLRRTNISVHVVGAFEEVELGVKM